jgi:glycosyltransferase involved in cell wall biosynthesis
MIRPRVLLTADYFLPGYRGGGPIQTLSAMAQLLRNEIDAEIWTLNHDWGVSQTYSQAEMEQVRKLGFNVQYFNETDTHLNFFANLIADLPPSAIFLNSLFSPRFTIPLIKLKNKGLLGQTRLILAPRGECAPAALAHKGYKKTAWLTLTKLLGFYRDIHWLASSEQESGQLRAFLTSQGLSDAPLTVLPEPSPLHVKTLDPSAGWLPKPPGSLKIIFLARIHPVKNLHRALDALALLAEPVQFDIYGPVGDGEQRYFQTCLKKMEDLRDRHTVTYHGPLDASLVQETLLKYDLFILPSECENFGHGILEAMAAGVPVLISDQTPWRNLAGASIGWDLPLSDLVAFTRVLQQARAMSEAQWLDLRQRTRNFARMYLSKSFDRNGFLKLILGT